VKKWVALDHCTGNPTIETIPDKVGDGTSINARTYSHCDGGSEVADYSIIDGGHAWPGGVPYSAEFLIGKTSKKFEGQRGDLGIFRKAFPLKGTSRHSNYFSCESFNCQKALDLSEHYGRAIDWQYCSAVALAQLFRQFPTRIPVSVMWERQACRLGSNDSSLGISSLHPLSSHPTSPSVRR
jgi:hypothetical protein